MPAFWRVSERRLRAGRRSESNADAVRIFSPRGCYLIAMLASTERAKAYRCWVLDVLHHLAELQLPALPDKTEDTAFENELKRAINQRAHSLSLRQFDDIRADLRRIVKKYGKGKTREEILTMVRAIETTDSGFYIIRCGDLRGMTFRCVVSHMMSAAVMEYIHKLEAETGAELYGRYDPREARACPAHPTRGGPRSPDVALAIVYYFTR